MADCGGCCCFQCVREVCRPEICCDRWLTLWFELHFTDGSRDPWEHGEVFSGSWSRPNLCQVAAGVHKGPSVSAGEIVPWLDHSITMAKNWIVPQLLLIRLNPKVLFARQRRKIMFLFKSKCQVESALHRCGTSRRANLASAVQYRVIPEKAVSAFYKLTDHKAQIKSYVFDGIPQFHRPSFPLHQLFAVAVIRSQVPRMELDHAFSAKSDIADAVKNQLSALMIEYGYEIIGILFFFFVAPFTW